MFVTSFRLNVKDHNSVLTHHCVFMYVIMAWCTIHTYWWRSVKLITSLN